jgi:hypothetical protein
MSLRDRTADKDQPIPHILFPLQDREIRADAACTDRLPPNGGAEVVVQFIEK